MRKDNDPITYSDTITCDESPKWNEAIIDELNFMKHYDVQGLAELPKGCNPLDARGSLRPN